MAGIGWNKPYPETSSCEQSSCSVQLLLCVLKMTPLLWIKGRIDPAGNGQQITSQHTPLGLLILHSLCSHGAPVLSLAREGAPGEGFHLHCASSSMDLWHLLCLRGQLPLTLLVCELLLGHEHPVKVCLWHSLASTEEAQLSLCRSTWQKTSRGENIRMNTFGTKQIWNQHVSVQPYSSGKEDFGWNTE